MVVALVFNLMMQQDCETKTNITHDIKDDSASMKIIVVMTMVFLPITAASNITYNFIVVDLVSNRVQSAPYGMLSPSSSECR